MYILLAFAALLKVQNVSQHTKANGISSSGIYDVLFNVCVTCVEFLARKSDQTKNGN